MGVGAVEVKGLRDLIRTFRELEPALRREWRANMVEVAEPVARRAEQLAGSEIANVLSDTAEVDWWRMRVGINAADGVVYVAPYQRGTKQGSGKRPNLAPLLLNRAMQPALQEKEPEIRLRVEALVDGLVAKYS